jgi:hypothetical protein
VGVFYARRADLRCDLRAAFRWARLLVTRVAAVLLVDVLLVAGFLGEIFFSAIYLTSPRVPRPAGRLEGRMAHG